MEPVDTRLPTEGTRRYAALMLGFFLLAYILPLGARCLMVPDETRYGEIPREMITGGDLVVPHLDGLRYFEKPALGYWVHAGSILLFGENRFAVRLPSALAVGLTCLLIYALSGLGCRGSSRQAGFPAALSTLIYLSSLEVFGVGTTAVLDSLFAFFLTASIAAFYFATEAPPGSAVERRYLLLSGLSCGLAFLTKGFLAFAIPVLALAPYLLWQRRFGDLWRMTWLPILTAVLVALPWSIAIHLREPDFWRFFFWNEHIRRFMADDAQHKKAFWFYFLTAPGMFIPWTFLVPAAVPAIRGGVNEQGPRGRLMRAASCWFLLPFLFFSVSGGKLLTYILPCFPPFAILMAFGLCHILEAKGRSRAVFQWGVAGISFLFTLILLAFLGVQFFGYGGVHPYGRIWKAVLAVSCLIFWLLCCIGAFKSRNGIRKVILFGMAPLLLYFTVPFIIPDPLLASKCPGRLLAQHRRDVGAHDIVISDEATLTAACWYFSRSDVYLLGKPDELRYGLSYPDAAGRRCDLATAIDLIRRNPGKTVLVARGKQLAKWRDRLPKPVSRDDNGPSGYVFWRY
jgi:4-amino-4-deoxy-L-arabinose transferase